MESAAEGACRMVCCRRCAPRAVCLRQMVVVMALLGSLLLLLVMEMVLVLVLTWQVQGLPPVEDVP